MNPSLFCVHCSGQAGMGEVNLIEKTIAARALNTGTYLLVKLVGY